MPAGQCVVTVGGAAASQPAAVLGEPLRVRQVDLRRVGRVLGDELQRVVPHVVLEVEREQPGDVAQLQQQLARVRVRLMLLEVLEARLRRSL